MKKLFEPKLELDLHDELSNRAELLFIIFVNNSEVDEDRVWAVSEEGLDALSDTLNDVNIEHRSDVFGMFLDLLDDSDNIDYEISELRRIEV